MLSELSSSFLVKNYINIQNLLNDVKIIENQHKNVFYYHFCFNRNKQTVISVIINKSLTFTEIIYMNCISFALIIFTFTFFVLFTYLNQKFSSVISKSES